jgi:DNA-directed RNA polymerase specialized sigma24 family protein
MDTKALNKLTAAIWFHLDANARYREDAMQAAAAAILGAENRAVSFGKTPSAGYLYQCGRKAALRCVIGLRKREGAPLGIDHQAAGGAGEEAMDARTYLDRLSGADLQLIHLRYWKQLTLLEIAQRLGLPVSTVDSRIRRALQKMRGSAYVGQLQG